MKRVALLAAVAVLACPPARAPDDGWKPDTSCNADADCVPAPGCCPVPCNEQVINRRDSERASSRLHCDDRPCAVAGGCRTFAYLCVRNQCALVFEGDADYRPRQP
jgi:hypothetical protein